MSEMLPNIWNVTDVRVHMAESDAHHLIRVARETDADVIVAGAYGHSRLGETIFGDMTRGLLIETPFWFMISH